MATPFRLDHDALARCALELRHAMLNFKHRDIPYFKEIIDQELEQLGPLLDLCIAKELEEPIYLSGAKIFDDVLAFPELMKPFFELARLLQGGMTDEEFWASEYYKERRLPRQMRENPQPDKSKLNRWGF
ncbi:hypothetical protein [Curvibacter delicatus]|uniref:hypothetical protein n=1 Tax=Curvibacter delicatus TaxID=80879 RepID=UPI000A6D76E7|nr:hypothetical protein [Curvibacter delicatus]